MECQGAMAHKQDPEHEQEQAKEQEQMPLVIVRLDTKGSKTPLQVAHSILARHNMPYGLLPMETLIECIYNPNDGRFKVTQPVHECDAVFGGHRIKLSREVSGRLLHNVIHDLKGVRVKAAAFLWFNIWNIEADPKPGKMIHFRAGPFNASMESQELWEYKFWAPAFKTKRKGGKGKKGGDEEEEEEEEEEEGETEREERQRVDAAIEAAMPIGKAAEQFTHLASKLHGARAAGSITRA